MGTQRQKGDKFFVEPTTTEEWKALIILYYIAPADTFLKHI